MKIRIGFVSNSSSSSYIVAVPKGFSVTSVNVNEWDADEIRDGDLWDEDAATLSKKGLEAVNSVLSSLSGGQRFDRDYSKHGELYYTMINVLEDNNLVVMCVDGSGGDGEDSIIPFKDLRKAKR